MERLSGLDASFLYIESPTQPLHVCSILELDTSTVPGGYTFEHLRDELALRIAAIPEFRAKLADSQLNLDYPVWVEDEEFDLDRHLPRGRPPPTSTHRLSAEVSSPYGPNMAERWSRTSTSTSSVSWNSTSVRPIRRGCSRRLPPPDRR
jgi:hypothetical protein